jgi:hypothetical protein
MENLTPNPAPTFESVWALQKEVFQEIRESHRLFKEELAETKRLWAEQRAEYEQQRKEEEKKRAEERAEYEQQRKEEEKARKNLEREIGGISNSNGDIAEEYFFNAFKRNKTFVNENFDHIDRNRSRTNGEIEAEFDILLFNGKSAAIIEVKYNAKPDNVRVKDTISKVDIFKILYPDFKNHKIYLGVAAFSFRKGLEERLHRAGIATIRQVGKKTVVYDKEVKAF